jgi:hypothetical protein
LLLIAAEHADAVGGGAALRPAYLRGSDGVGSVRRIRADVVRALRIAPLLP